MVLLACDLDNTLIYSRRRLTEFAAKGGASWADFCCVERLNGREQSYMSRRSIKMLAALKEKAMFVPVTTRSIEQYRRIEFPTAIKPAMALVANGAILLSGEQSDRQWRERSRGMIAAVCRAELEGLARRFGADDAFAKVAPRFVDDMFLFMRVDDEADFSAAFARVDSATDLDVFSNGRKIYIFPVGLDKGTALLRFKERLNEERPRIFGNVDYGGRIYTFAAGDSPIDVPLLDVADCAFAPHESLMNDSPEKVVCDDDKRLFAEQILSGVEERI